MGTWAQKTKWRQRRWVDRKVSRINRRCVKSGSEVTGPDIMSKKKRKGHLLITCSASFSLLGNHVKLASPFYPGGNWASTHKVTQLLSDRSFLNTKHSVRTRTHTYALLFRGNSTTAFPFPIWRNWSSFPLEPCFWKHITTVHPCWQSRGDDFGWPLQPPAWVCLAWDKPCLLKYIRIQLLAGVPGGLCDSSTKSILLAWRKTVVLNQNIPWPYKVSV